MSALHNQDAAVARAHDRSFAVPAFTDQPGYVVDAIRRIEDSTLAELRAWGVPRQPVDDGSLIDVVVDGALGEDHDDLTELDADDLAELREAADRRLTPVYR
jgi:hypothetical protein